MIPGLNTDVRYKGKTFHIQTEDSGVDNPVLMTHVFLGGTILGSEKQSYQVILGQADFDGRVRELMRAQHRAMYRALLEGRYDDLARRPTQTKGRPEGRSIPLANANRTPGMGVVNSGRISAPPGALPPEASVESPPGLSGARRATSIPPPLPPMGDESDLEPPLPYDLAALSHPVGAVPFPTDLTSGRRLPDVMLAYLLEDPEEG